MAFRRGAQAAEEAAKYSSFARTNFFKIEEGKSAVLRFITDVPPGHVDGGRYESLPDDDPRAFGGLITVNMHQNIPTKAKPSDYKGENWPGTMPAVCRKEEAFEGKYPDCYICDVIIPQNSKLKKPSPRQWAIAVLREEVRGDGSADMGGAASKGKILGYKDATRTVTRKKGDSEETEEIEEKAIVFVNQGWKNFFGALSGFASIYGTVLDRDYVIQRKGKEKDTDYNLIPLDPITLGDGRPFDLRDEALLKERYGMTHQEAADLLEQVVSERASDDFYGQWFVPGYKTSATSGATGASESPSSPEPDEETMEALRARIEGYGGADGAAAPQESPQNEAAATEQPEPAAAASGGGMKSFD